MCLEEKLRSANMDWTSLTQELGVLAINCKTLSEDFMIIFNEYWYLGSQKPTFRRNGRRKYSKFRLLNVLVFYESLCPDSKRFMQNQLGPNYDELGDFIDIKLVPFANAKSVDDGKEIVCQHGPAECLGNLK
uniref:Uncharacterized protein n=1 Tax=Glossina morsitans morsitans TaxID=37546 RepID=A0A1B0F9A4_GLOMM